MSHNYYNATFSIVTARRAQIMGIRVARHYGYYVLISPPVFDEGRRPGMERVECWCDTKNTARYAVDGKQRSQQKGYYGCPCGEWQGQACACPKCGKVIMGDSAEANT